MNWDEIAEGYLAVADEVLGGMKDALERTAEDLARRIKAGSKVLICGNGGSAGDAQHFAGELVNRFLKERRPYAGIALTTDSSILTAISNDYDFSEVFSKQVEALGREGDVLIGISTSGNAANVVKAVETAKSLGVHTIGMTGGGGGKLAETADELICVGCSSSVPRIQEGHGLIIHLLCERVEEILS
jgi:D-sedoheptulose 7-phosphate isomerase